MVYIDIVIPVYKPGDRFKETLLSITRQIVDSNIELKVYIVDDGNNDADLIQIVGEFKSMKLVILKSNAGRAKACNHGVLQGKGQFIFFLDADCEILGKELINQHCKVLLSGFDVSYGSTKSQVNQNEFWETYLKAVEKKREKLIASGIYSLMTSNNIAIRRTLFEQVGGFDQNYRGYGFEDRDLVAKLIKLNARIKYSAALIVYHDVGFSLSDVIGKLEEAGELTSGVFAKNHPEQYRKLTYYYFDVRCHPIALKLPLVITNVILIPLVKRIDGHLLKNKLLRPGMVILVKLLSAMAFLKGTGKRISRG